MKVKHFLILSFLYLTSFSAKAYSLLTHEALIDVSWSTSIQPLLLTKYPGTTNEQLLEAHSYAYGGAIMPDIGYSPFGSMIYTDFVHNVRTGDYVKALLEEAQTLNEYAFALGSLAHYLADSYGHQLGTNVAVPIVYPKVRAKFGNVVTYADHQLSHSRMELAFDVLQTARGNYASKNYHDFIGFSVARPVVERAFYKTYGIDVNDIFKNMSVAISTFRWTIKSFLPTLVRTAWASKKHDLKKVDSTLTARRFSYRMKNRTYYHEFGKEHQKAGFFPTVISFMLPILPKIGPLAKLRYKTPTPETEKLFIKSFETALLKYDLTVSTLYTTVPKLSNRTLDTGHETVFGEYAIADSDYATFLLMLKERNFATLNVDIKDNILGFYEHAKTPAFKNKKAYREWQKVQQALVALKQTTTIAKN